MVQKLTEEMSCSYSLSLCISLMFGMFRSIVPCTEAVKVFSKADRHGNNC
jgi:hypothetical protein